MKNSKDNEKELHVPPQMCIVIMRVMELFARCSSPFEQMVIDWFDLLLDMTNTIYLTNIERANHVLPVLKCHYEF